MSYLSEIIDLETAKKICYELYQIEGGVKALPGEVDFNFKISSDQNHFLKISRTKFDINYWDFQQDILQYVNSVAPSINCPKVISDRNNNSNVTYFDSNGNERKVRLLSWAKGRLRSQINPKSDPLREQLGNYCGKLT